MISTLYGALLLTLAGSEGGAAEAQPAAEATPVPRNLMRAGRVLAPLPEYEVRRASSPIVIDGVLNEAAWQEAAILTLIFPYEEQTGSKQNTLVRMLWDDQCLYVGYECEDTDITAVLTERDMPTFRDDAVEVFLNPAPEQQFYYGLEMNALGTIFDMVRAWPAPAFVGFDLKDVQIATHLNGTLNDSSDVDRGWSLEVALPWKNYADLAKGNLPPKPGDRWRANVARWDGTEPDRRISLWSDSDLVVFGPHNPERFGWLTFK